MAFLAKKLTRSFPLVRIHRTFPILVQHSHFPQERAEISAIFFFLENLMERLFVDQSKSRLGSQPGRVVSSVPNLRKKKKNVRDEIFPVHEVLWDVLHRICQVESIVVAVHAFMSSLCKLNRVARVAKSKFLIAVRQLVQSFSVGMDCSQHCFTGKNFALKKEKNSQE